MDQAQPEFANQPCPECKAQMAARIPKFSVFNSPTVSIVSATHERLDKCNECGSIFIPVIVGVTPNLQIVFQFKKIEAPSGIVAPTQANMSQAVNLDKITKGFIKQ